MTNERIVLACSGGLASTAAISRLIETRRADVVAVVLDLGQGEALDGVRERTLAAGAVKCHVLDRAASLVRDVAWPVARAGMDVDPGGRVLAAPVIARGLVDVARLERASVVAHACRDERSRRRLSLLVQTLDASLGIVVPPNAPNHNRRPLGAGLDSRGDAASDGETAVHVNTTLWGRVVTGAGLGDPWESIPESLFTLTRVSQAPDAPATLEISFEGGVPTQVNGVDLPLAELVDVVTTIAGAHGIGRHERTTSGGPTARELHESPAAAVLRQAHRDLEGATLSADQVAFRPIVAAQYAALVDEGRWYSPLRVALDAYTDAVQSAVNGTVRLRLFKGDCRVIGRRTVLHDRSPIAAGAGR